MSFFLRPLDAILLDLKAGLKGESERPRARLSIIRSVWAQIE
jgi:hypothetical protein